MYLFKKAIFVIHGFGGGTWENEYLVNYIQKYRGFDAFAWTIKGHEKDVVDDVSYEDYISSMEEKLIDIFNYYHTVYIVGHSMGGIIATYLANKYSPIKKLVLLAPAFDYISLNQNFKDIKKINNLIKEDNNDVIYNDLLSKVFRVPIDRIVQFTKIVKKYKKEITKINIPTLIIHGDSDEVIPLKASEYAFDSVLNNHKYLMTIIGGRHRLLRGPKKELISKITYSFLKGGIKWKKYKKLKEL